MDHYLEKNKSNNLEKSKFNLNFRKREENFQKGKDLLLKGDELGYKKVI